MKRTLLFVILILALPSLACSFSLPNSRRIETGPTQTVTVDEPAPDMSTSENPADVRVQMGAGQLKLQSGAEGLVEGRIKYNVAEWAPVVSRENGQVTIKQSWPDGKQGGWYTDGNDVVNNWNLKLGDVPMNLTVDAGAFEGQMDLGGLRLRELTVNSGACDNTLTFDKANPEPMTELVYRTGASAGHLKGLGYANFEHMVFKAGVGDYDLDFTGQLQRDASADVEAGMSSLRIVIPSDMKAKVVVDGGLKEVKTEGAWSVDGDTYETGQAADHTLTIHVTMALGGLTLVRN